MTNDRNCTIVPSLASSLMEIRCLNSMIPFLLLLDSMIHLNLSSTWPQLQKAIYGYIEMEHSTIGVSEKTQCDLIFYILFSDWLVQEYVQLFEFSRNNRTIHHNWSGGCEGQKNFCHGDKSLQGDIFFQFFNNLCRIFKDLIFLKDVATLEDYTTEPIPFKASFR